MADRGGPPILVTGMPRSGTSWTGRMLEASGAVVYVNEPLNPRHPPGRSPGVLAADVSSRFQYIAEGQDEEFLAAFRDTVRLRYRPLLELRRNHRPYDLARLAKYWLAFSRGRYQHRRAMIDDPYAILSTAWFATALGADVVVLVREPAAVVSSWLRFGWTVDFGDLLGQPRLMADHLEADRALLQQLRDPAAPDLDRVAVLWRLLYAVVDSVRRLHPRIRVIRHEELAADPVAGFRRLYTELGLTMTPDAARYIAATTTGGSDGSRALSWSFSGGLPSRTGFRRQDSRQAASAWQSRMSAEEIDRVRQLTAPVRALYYPSGDAAAGGR